MAFTHPWLESYTLTYVFQPVAMYSIYEFVIFHQNVIKAMLWNNYVEHIYMFTAECF